VCELAAVSSIGNISGEPELGGWREAARGGEEQHCVYLLRENLTAGDASTHV